MISQGFCHLCQVTYELQLFSWWTICGCCWSTGTVHITQLVLRMFEIIEVSFNSLSPFPFFLWRGIHSLGSHIRFVHSSTYLKGKCKLFLWLVGCCQTQTFLQTWYHSHLESVSLLELYILSFVNRDKHTFLFFLHTLPKGGCPGMKYSTFFPIKNIFPDKSFPPACMLIPNGSLLAHSPQKTLLPFLNTFFFCICIVFPYSQYCKRLFI